MKYLLDTDISVYLLNGNEILEQKVRRIGVSAIGISLVTLSELYFGAYSSVRIKENIERIEKFASYLCLHLCNAQVAQKFGEMKAALRRLGKPLEDFDILIACIALTNGCTLVTHNVKHFERIPGLELQDWLA